jgi:hypothetical protein
LKILEQLGKIVYSPEFFDMPAYLGELEVHFGAGIVDEVFLEGSVKNHSGNHVSVSVDLQNVSRLLIGCSHHGKKIFQRAR